jgi:hypothetical protein
MSAFSTMAEAESRARVLMADGKMATNGVIVAHVCRSMSGVIGIRVQRRNTVATFTGQDTVDGNNKAGAWDFITDSEAT